MNLRKLKVAIEKAPMLVTDEQIEAAIAAKDSAVLYTMALAARTTAAQDKRLMDALRESVPTNERSD